MQTQVPARHAPENAVTTLSLSPQPDVPLAEYQMAELHEAWLEHQVNPLRVIQERGVSYSPMND